MINYVVRRLAQAVPQLFIISILLFGLMQAFGDPIATLGGRTPPRSSAVQLPREEVFLRQRREERGLDDPLRPEDRPPRSSGFRERRICHRGYNAAVGVEIDFSASGAGLEAGFDPRAH